MTAPAGLLLLMLATTFSVQAMPLHFEAEEGTLRGAVYVDAKAPGFSGWGYVTSFSQPDDGVDVQIDVPAAGFYTLRIGYAAKEAKINPVLINGSIQGNRLFPSTQGFGKMTFGRVALHSGKNRVSIGTDWGWIDVDYIELEAAPPPIPFRLAEKPVTRDASVEAKELFKMLRGTFGRKILAGQQDEQGQRLASIAKLTGGKAPAILGLDLLNYSGAYDRPDGQIERAKDWVLKKHGIVTLSWHWFSPFGGTGEVWESFSSKKTTFDASKVTDENSPEYKAIIRDLDLVAGELKVLRDAHVPVLWRPLHEAEGKWFWWGAQGPETTRQLYRLMFDRFTRVHGLNNLLWVWTSTDNPGARDWYPGDDCVDIVGADLYGPAGVHGTFLSVFDNLRQIYGGRKMIALCEAGALAEPDELAKERADWLWFLIWDDYISRPKMNPVDLISRTYSNEHILRLDHFTPGTEKAAKASK